MAFSTMQEIGEDENGRPRLALAASPAPVAYGVDGASTGASALRAAVPALALEIATQARNGGRHFQIQLDPPELGRIDVRLDFARDGNMTTKLIVERPETLDLLMRDARALEKALQTTGLKLEDGSVQYQLRDQSAFARQDKPGPQQQGGNRPDDSGDEDTSQPEHPPPWQRVSLSAIDMRV